MNMNAILERPTVVGFEASIKNGVIEVPVEYRKVFLEPVFVEIRVIDEKKIANKGLERAYAYGRSLAEKYGFTEDDLNNEIDAYRREKTVNENSY